MNKKKMLYLFTRFLAAYGEWYSLYLENRDNVSLYNINHLFNAAFVHFVLRINPDETELENIIINIENAILNWRRENDSSL